MNPNQFTPRYSDTELGLVPIGLIVGSSKFGRNDREIHTPHRIDNAAAFWCAYKDDRRYIHWKTGERCNDLVTLEAPSVFTHNGIVEVEDGGHRVLAWERMGYTHIVVEASPEFFKAIG